MPHCLQQYLGSFFCHDITNFNAANSELFWANTSVNFYKQAAEEIHWFPSLKLSKHEIVWKQHTKFLKRASGWFQKTGCRKSVLCTKRENWYYLKYNSVVSHVWIWIENGLCHADNARTHTFYMLCSTTRKSTWRLCICITVYEIYHFPDIQYR